MAKKRPTETSSYISAAMDRLGCAQATHNLPERLGLIVAAQVDLTEAKRALQQTVRGVDSGLRDVAPGQVTLDEAIASAGEGVPVPGAPKPLPPEEPSDDEPMPRSAMEQSWAAQFPA